MGGETGVLSAVLIISPGRYLHPLLIRRLDFWSHRHELPILDPLDALTNT